MIEEEKKGGRGRRKGERKKTLSLEAAITAISVWLIMCSMASSPRVS